MNRTETIELLREVLNDSLINGIWDERTLIRYLAEAQDKFCEDTGYFSDISNFTITLQTGVAVYAIPDRVIQILDIWSGSRKLYKIDIGDDDYEGVDANSTPTHWRTDRETGIINLYPTPTSDDNGDTLVLQVWRYSQNDFNTADIDFEIPSRFHYGLICYAAYKAMMHHDMEAQDKVKAGEHLAMYQSYVSDGRQALRRYQNMEVRVGSDPAYRT